MLSIRALKELWLEDLMSYRFKKQVLSGMVP
jgi:hypothetical protein